MSDQVKDGGPAFPGESYNGQVVPGNTGMTLRDWFASNAPMMTEQWFQDSLAEEGGHWLEAQSAWAYAYADAMLAEREKRQ